jgi:protein involved in polysaccharide export with SLBB domain
LGSFWFLLVSIIPLFLPPNTKQNAKAFLYYIMKLTRFFACLLAFGLFCLPVFGQILNADNLQNVKVDALSDEELKSYYQKAMASGLTQEQLLTLALGRGLPQEEADKLKARLTALETGVRPAGAPKNAAKSNGESNNRVLSDEPKAETINLGKDPTIFGSELFTTASLGFESSAKIATPASYTLGPGDELLINVYGYSEQAYKLLVSNEGVVYIPNVGPIAVSGLTVGDAANKIKARLAATIYKAINSGQTKVQVVLSSIRSIQVTVIGQASRPGTYTVSSLTTLFNLLYQCGGPSDMGSYRHIEVVRAGKLARTLDLYAYLLRGDKTDNVLLQDQDVVRIPYYISRVKIEGEVKRPGKFEVKKGENFDQLLTYSGGFTDLAWRGSVKVTRIEDNGRVINDLAAGDFGGYTPKTGDAYLVTAGLMRYQNRVTIAGAVLRPGEFELVPGLTLKQLIEKAGGLKPDAFYERGIIDRLNEDRTPASVAFDAAQVVKGNGDLPLKAEDRVEVPSIYDLKDQASVQIEGEVRKPGRMLYQDDITLKDLIVKAGGFTDIANKASIEINRRVKPDMKSIAPVQMERILIDLTAGLKPNDSDLELKPFDYIVVRPVAGVAVSRSVYVEGEVLNTGKFVLSGPGDRISSIIARAGGFTSSADSSSVSIKRFKSLGLSKEERQKTIERVLQINRDSVVKNPNLSDDYMKDVQLLSVNVQKIKDGQGGNEDLILEDGDVISISRASSLVRVSGEVYYPTSLPYEANTDAKFYIKRSGYFTSTARRSKVFVIYPDGRAKAVKRFLWFKSYPEVTPRSEIFVPGKSVKANSITTAEWLAISTIAASLGGLVIGIVNATR